MNASELSALKNELATDPAALGYAPLLSSGQLGAVCDLLNAQTQKKVQSRYVTARTILAELSDGAAVLDALDACPMSAVKWAMKFLGQDSGLDVGNPATQGMLDALSAAAVITASQAAELKAMAELPASRAQVIGVPAVTVEDIYAAGV
jgi:hypothetical protein